MNWIKYSILTLILSGSLLILLFIGDIIAKRVLDLGQPIVYDSHPLWGYAPRENHTYERFDGDIVTINDVGARGEKDWNNNGNNIIFLGDSVTYGGSYIGDNQTFASLSCQTIENWTCHNVGVNAYGVLNMVARSRYDKRISLAPLRIFTFITGDFDRGLKDQDTAHFIMREPPNYFSGLWEIMNFIAAKVNISPKHLFGKKSDIYDTELLDEAKRLKREFALDVLTMELQRLDQIGLEFLLVHSPRASELDYTNIPKNNPILRKLSNLYPDRFIFLSDILANHYKNGDKQIYRDGLHYEVFGHILVSNYLSPIIAKNIKKDLK
ncbi:hypothetical protein OAS94_00090 [Candidatus Pelagibacter sp.]|nr:hypothetical protein [Candidatus Pelagibacter sp.]